MLQRQIIIFNIASKVRQFQLSNICLYHEAQPYYIILWTHTDDTMKPLKYIYKLSTAGLEKLKFDNITANYDKKTINFGLWLTCVNRVMNAHRRILITQEARINSYTSFVLIATWCLWTHIMQEQIIVNYQYIPF